MKSTFAPLVVLIAAVGVLTVATPNLIAQMAALPGQRAVDLLLDGKVPDTEGFDRLLRSRKHALTIVDNPAWRIDMGSALLVQSLLAARSGTEPGSSLDKARGWLRVGLAHAPADEIGWLWLATVEMRRENWPDAAAALKLSLLSAPMAPHIAITRASLELQAWPKLDPETAALIVRELAITLKRVPDDLVAAADELGLRERLREVLTKDDEASVLLEGVERHLEGLP